jgi:hypothetical protein
MEGAGRASARARACSRASSSCCSAKGVLPRAENVTILDAYYAGCLCESKRHPGLLPSLTFGKKTAHTSTAAAYLVNQISAGLTHKDYPCTVCR